MAGRPDWRGLRWLTASMTVEERFWMKVDGGDVETCWVWTASLKPGGYGHFAVAKGKAMGAHKWAYVQLRGEVPAGLHLDHLCRNRACVNPWHLEPVTPKVNAERGAVAQRQTCPSGHPYDEANTARRGGRRYCRICTREHIRSHWARKAAERAA